MDLAIRDVRQHVGKFLASIVGVGGLLSIVLTMNGIYRGNIHDGLWLIENTPTDLWVVERYRGGPFNEQSKIPEVSYRMVRAVPGVEKASPFISYTVEREVGGKSQQFTIIGYDVFGDLGGPQSVVAGRGIKRAHYELVADLKLGLSLGERIPLGVHEYTVVGLVKGAVDSGGNPLAYLSLRDAQEVLYQQENQALRAERAAELQSFERSGLTPFEAERVLTLFSSNEPVINAVLVKLAPGAKPQTVAGLIEEGLYLSVYTREEEGELMLKGRLRRMTQILGLFRSLLIVVSIVIIALLLYILTLDKIRSIATLKILGAQNWIIVRLILEQSLVISISSFGLGHSLIRMTMDRFPRTLVLLTSDTAITFAVIVVGGVLASLMGIWHALRTPPSLALGS
jgi:putative ABC transport system permease protein